MFCDLIKIQHQSSCFFYCNFCITSERSTLQLFSAFESFSLRIKSLVETKPFETKTETAKFFRDQDRDQFFRDFSFETETGISRDQDQDREKMSQY